MHAVSISAIIKSGITVRLQRKTTDELYKNSTANNLFNI